MSTTSSGNCCKHPPLVKTINFWFTLFLSSLHRRNFTSSSFIKSAKFLYNTFPFNESYFLVVCKLQCRCKGNDAFTSKQQQQWQLWCLCNELKRKSAWPEETRSEIKKEADREQESWLLQSVKIIFLSPTNTTSWGLYEPYAVASYLLCHWAAVTH